MVKRKSRTVNIPKKVHLVQTRSSKRIAEENKRKDKKPQTTRNSSKRRRGTSSTITKGIKSNEISTRKITSTNIITRSKKHVPTQVKRKIPSKLIKKTKARIKTPPTMKKIIKKNKQKSKILISNARLPIDFNFLCLEQNKICYSVIKDTLQECNGESFDVKLVQKNALTDEKFVIHMLLVDNLGECYIITKHYRNTTFVNEEWVKMESLDKAKAEYLMMIKEKLYLGYEEDSTALDSLIGQGTILPEDKISQLALSNLLDMIFNENLLKEQIQKFGYDLTELPLSKLRQEHLIAAYKILQLIESFLWDPKSFGGLKMTLSQLTQQFYTVIPHSFDYNTLHSQFMIDTIEKLREKSFLLESLGNISHTLQMINQADPNNNKYEEYYKLINCNIQHLSKDHQSITKLFYDNMKPLNKYQEISLLEIFQITSLKEYVADLPNKKFLWLGIKASDVASILSRGLLLPDPEAPKSIFNYGRGIYFTDNVHWATRDCLPLNNIGFLLLCEVALGKSKQVDEPDWRLLDELEEEYDSICREVKVERMVQHRISEVKSNIELKIIKEEVSFKEFVVYDLDQIKIKYLIKIRFDFKRTNYN